MLAEPHQTEVLMHIVRSWSWLRIIPLVALTFVVAACSDAFGPGGTLGVEQRDLSRARRTWSNNDIRDYEYVVSRNCFCVLGGVAVRVTVRNDVVIAREIDGTSTPIPQSMAALYPSIDGLFIVIQDAIDSRAYQLDTRYDSTYGFPTDVWIDYDRRIADEEEGYRLLRFRSLR